MENSNSNLAPFPPSNQTPKPKFVNNTLDKSKCKLIAMICLQVVDTRT